jgi:ABC-type multidrug transport system fused ATPase/permease subunit
MLYELENNMALSIHNMESETNMAEQKTKISAWKVIKYQMKVITDMKKWYVFIIYIMYMLLSGLLPITTVWFPRHIIDAIYNGSLTQMSFYTIWFCISATILAVGSFLLEGYAIGNFLEMRLEQYSIYHRKYKDVSFQYLENPDFIAQRSSAMRTLSNNDEGFQGTYTLIFRLLPEIVSIIGFVIILGTFKPVIIFVAIGTAIIQYLITVHSKKMSFRERENLAEAERKANYFYEIGHDFNYGKDIRLNQMSEKLQELHKSKSSVFTLLFGKIKKHEYKMGLFDLVFSLLTNGLAYFWVITAYFQGDITLGQLSMTIWAIIAISYKLQQAGDKIAKIKVATDFTGEFLRFMNNEAYFPVNGSIINKLHPFQIELKNVCFKYPGTDKYVLNHLNLKIDAKEKLALVGLNGSGKTTLVKLLCGFYQPTEGEIIINDQKLADFNLEKYRDQIAVVFQDTNIYAASIIENITGENADKHHNLLALSALEKVGLAEKIATFPEAENKQLLKVIDPEGTEFSGGEIQKLAMARALYKGDTGLVILDEPTASLDAIAERDLYQKFETLISGRTAIMISHRLASTRFCDKIAYLANGIVKEYGTHDELMNMQDGSYRHMFLVQGKYYREEGNLCETTENA